jgi:Na+-translocating ferredoxin:NAD+ oxidoreductase RnfC subunit
MCTDLCPRYLIGHDMQPHKMMRTLAYFLADTDEQKISYLCCQCNLCELFSCPAGLYPKSANMMIKQKLMEQGIKYQPQPKEYAKRSSREYRLLPSKRLIARLGLRDFDKAAPMTESTLNPQIVRIALCQHVGAPAVPVVAAGDQVQAGQLIGKIPEGSLGAAVHASISGTVMECENGYIAIRR